MSIDFQSVVRKVELADKAAPDLAKLKKATDGFEAIFLKKLFSQMRASVKETQFGQTFGKEIYEDMFNEAMANAAAKSKTLGMGDMLYNQFAPRVIGIVEQEMARDAKLSVTQKLSDAPAAAKDLSTTDPKLEGPISNPHDLLGRATSRKP